MGKASKLMTAETYEAITTLLPYFRLWELQSDIIFLLHI